MHPMQRRKDSPRAVMPLISQGHDNNECERNVPVDSYNIILIIGLKRAEESNTKRQLSMVVALRVNINPSLHKPLELTPMY